MNADGMGWDGQQYQAERNEACIRRRWRGLAGRFLAPAADWLMAEDVKCQLAAQAVAHDGHLGSMVIF
jgi:hypothetical protein